MTKLANPDPLFLDGRGALLDGGYIYIGTAGTDPEVVANQLPVFWDSGLTIAAAQPLRTLGGVVVNGTTVTSAFFSAADYSLKVRDADGNLVRYIASVNASVPSYQPLDSDLTAIAALATTAYGRNLLALANQAALQTAVGIGTAALLDEASSAHFRANTPDKALSTDQVWAAAAAVPLAEAAGAVAVDLSTGLNFTLAMTGNWTLSSPVNGKAGQAGFIEITQDATGGRTLAYGAGWKFDGGADPVLSTAANARDVLFYQVLSDGTAVFGSLRKAVA